MIASRPIRTITSPPNEERRNEPDSIQALIARLNKEAAGKVDLMGARRASPDWSPLTDVRY